MACSVAPAHSPEDRVGSGLQRDVDVFGKTGRRCNKFQQFVGPVHGLDRAQAQLCDTRLGQHFSKQMSQARFFGKVPAPSSKVDSGEHNLAITFRQHSHLLDDESDRSAPAGAAHGGDHAEAAAIAAAVLNLEVGTRAIRSRLDNRRREKLLLVEDVSDQRSAKADLSVVSSLARRSRGLDQSVGNDRPDPCLVRITDDPLDAGETSEFRRVALSVAARYKNLALRIFSIRVADRLPGIPVRFRRDGTGVDDDEIGRTRCGFQTSALQVSRDGGAIRLRSAAAEASHGEAPCGESLAGTHED